MDASCKRKLQAGAVVQLASKNFPELWNLLGQLWVLHVCEDVDMSGQSAPPYCGAGLLHVRVLDWIPPPQVTVQLPQLPQAAQLPSTVKMKLTFQLFVTVIF